MFEFNINHKVRVRLTDHGRKIHRENWVELCGRNSLLRVEDYRPKEEDVDGWSEWQLWALMAAFGQDTGAGKPLCFEPVIRIPGLYQDAALPDDDPAP